VHDGDRTLRRFVDLYRDYKGVVPYYTEIDINAGDSWTGIGALGTKGGFVSEKRIPDAWDNRFIKGKKDLDKKWSKYTENGIGIKFKRRNDDGGLISEEEMKQIFDIFIEYPAVSAYRNGKDYGLEKEEDKNKF